MAQRSDRIRHVFVKAVLVASVGASALSAGAASAQTLVPLDDGQSPASQPGTQGAAEPAPAQEETGLEEVVVTAQRRSERLQDVPASISAFTGDQLERAGITSTRDLQVVTPSLSFVQASYAPQPTIRGIGTRNVNPGDEQVVPIYLDGVYQPFIVGGIFELSNIERVEVLNGPQGTLLGRNATGGAINIITRAPSVVPTGELSIGYGSFDERRIAGYVSGGSGPISASLSAQYLEDDGYVRELTSGRQIANVRSLFVRGQVQLQLSDRTRIRLAASHATRDDNTSVSVYPWMGNTVARQGRPTLQFPISGREVALDLVPALNISQDAVSVTIAHDFGPFILTSISGYSENTLDYRADIDGTPFPHTQQFVRQFENGFTQELFATSTGTGRFRWVVGGFYFDDEAGFNPRRSNTTITNTQTEIRAWAAYAQGSYSIFDGLTLTLGGRYSRDRKCASADNGIGTRVLARTCANWDSFNPSATVDYRINDDFMVYVRYATAFKSGVFNAASFSAVPVNPEQVETWEAGIRADPTDWLRTNLSVFYTDYDNMQVNTRDPATAAVVLQNAASARLYGIEADVLVRPVRGLNLRGAFTALSARYVEFLNAQIFMPVAGGGNAPITINASDLRLVRVPEFSASVSADYTFGVAGGDLTVSGNAFYQGGFDWQVGGRLQQPSYTTVNGQIAWRSRDRSYEIALWVRNLTDVQPPLSIITSTINDQASYSRPRSVGVRLTTSF